jgi:hypothetical protein
LSLNSPLCDDRRLESLPSLSVRLPCLGSVPPPPPALEVSLDAELRRMRPEAVREGLSPRRREAESALDEEEGIVSFFPFSLSLVSAQLRLRFSSRPRRDGCPGRSPLVSGMRERGSSRAREEQRERERDLCCPRLFLFLVFEQQQKNSSLSLLHSSILILRCLARGRVLPLSE